MAKKVAVKPKEYRVWVRRTWEVRHRGPMYVSDAMLWLIPLRYQRVSITPAGRRALAEAKRGAK